MKEEMSERARVALAVVLTLVVMGVWTYFYRPAPPPPISPAQVARGTLPGAGPAAPAAAAAAASPKTVVQTPPVADTAEKTIVVESGLYRVELSNRGAVVRSWQLKQYSDESKPPRTLDLVNAAASQQTGDWPFALQLSDGQQAAEANQGLYVITANGGPADTQTVTSLTAPAQVQFRWSNGQLDVTKTLQFDRGYVVAIRTTVRNDGQPVPHGVAWGGGFGDITAFRAAPNVFDGLGGKITSLAAKNLGDPNQKSRYALQPGSFEVVGIQDLYFAAAFLPPEPPPGQAMPSNLALWTRQVDYQARSNNSTSTSKQTLPEMAAGSAASDPLALRVFVGPKDLDTLKAIRPSLGNLVQFGWSGFIAEPLFYSLRWLHRYVPNYGWAIVLLTIAINMLLYPLKLKSWRSMQKMQKVAPEIRSIQDRYKKYTMRDPRKAEMNKEVMAVYSREGINPMGSCLPMVVQFPIWFGLNEMLRATIELRHAPWFGWIHDLSDRDPYYILPIVMSILMYAVQKMTPTTVTDPSQQRMMNLMPLVFSAMFIIYPFSSGLVLYILTSNIVAVFQQWHLNRTSPLKVPGKWKKKQ